jgi:putative ABC transport system substrate-binding protein
LRLEVDNISRDFVKRETVTVQDVELALKYRLPTVSNFREFAEAGGLVSHSATEADVYREAARLVEKILKGATPTELPVEQSTKFE